MKLRTLLFRNLLFFWHTNLAIIAGVGIAVAVLSGALLVGQSVRSSLRELLYERIGATEYAISSNHFFRQELADAFHPAFASCAIVFLKGVVIHEGTRVRAHDVNVYGIDERFWMFHGATDRSSPEGNSAIVGEALARQLDVRAGDALLLRIETQQSVPKEWLYGRRDNVGRTIRLNCREILPATRLGEFALRPSQGNVFSIFVPLQRLQRDLGQPSRANTILLRQLSPKGGSRHPIQDALKKDCTLSDLGLNLRAFPSGKGFSLESGRIILEDLVAQAAFQAASAAGMKFSPVFTYLANSIRAKGREIPYSVMSAVDLGQGAMTSVSGTANAQSDPIWLTDWAARDLAVTAGDPVEVDYYLWLDSGQLVTRTSRFQLAGVVPMSADVDDSLAPQIPGITAARSISAWDPPFPLDLSRIRPEDEDYWNRYKATPKAFIPLAKGRQLWGNRFGNMTSVRIAPPEAINTGLARERFSAELLRRLDPEQSGFSIAAIKEQGLAASRGSTDFGEYFLYFSAFLIMAAILLAALLFRLMIEQRVREIGILRAAGFPLPVLRRILVFEGVLLSVGGSLLGLLGALGYASLMVFGLRTWWIDAVGTHRLYFHNSWPALLLGAAAGIIFSVLAILWSLRGLRRHSPRMLLAGVLEPDSMQARRARSLSAVAIISLILALLLVTLSSVGKMSQLEGFFGSGFLLLISILCATAVYLRRKSPSLIQGNGWVSFLRFGIRNAMHRPGRSLICASLIAAAVFVIMSMEAFRQDSRSISLDFDSGTGGYPLVGESVLPIIEDPNSDAGRETMGLTEPPLRDPAKLDFVSFRERAGDDASCLNLYAPKEPKIIGAPHRFLAAGRFSFQDSVASDEVQRKNPWLLLESSTDPAVIPAVADANTIQYILHLSLGSEITVRSDAGTPVRLRLVAALRDSIFQGELIISESNFLRSFPEHQGYRFFLLDLPQAGAAEAKKDLQEQLADWGLNIEGSRERLSAYHRVESTYLSTFQSLGSLGLVLGTFGLATILLRNVLERRQELALLRATGYRKWILSGIILSENFALICWGLLSGAICAFLAVIPALQSRGAAFPFAISGLILLSVLAAGMISSVLAVIAALRSPLLFALHSE